jgi:hypothetical protein
MGCAMKRRYDGPPMDLANMRANGVRSLSVYCVACHRSVRFNVDAYPDDMLVVDFGPRMVCTGCGKVGVDARPDWTEQEPFVGTSNFTEPHGR